MVTTPRDSSTPHPTPHTPHPTLITVQGLHKRYGRVAAVQGIDFSVQQGEVFGLIGPDGAGKTTTFHILGGVMEATMGTVQVLGRAPRDARLGIGYLTQQFSLYLDLSIDENLRYVAGLRNVSDRLFAERWDKYLRLMNLEKFGDRLAGQLSGGMKQKLALCCALIYKPEVLLLDEPTTGVDPVSRREFWDVLAALASEGVTIVVATPYLDEAERCNRVALMYNGQIQQIGTPAELKASLGLHPLEVRTGDLAAVERVLLAAGEKAEGRGQRAEGEDAERGRHGDTESSLIQNSKFNTQNSTLKIQHSKLSQIADVQTFGDRLDILVSDAQAGETEVRNLLNQHHLPFDRIDPMQPTLENVFVNRLRQQGLEPPFIPFPQTRSGSGEWEVGSREKASIQNSKLKTQNSSPTPHTPHPTPPFAIYARKLNRVFGNFQAVKNVNVEVRYGEIFGLLGANGAGKTTTIKMLCGLLEASSGEISLGGETGNLRSGNLRRRIGYMSQKFTLYDDLSIRQNLEFYAGVYSIPQRLRRSKIDWVLTICGLEGQEDLITGQLPGGWKQRVAFGASVMHEPEILFLDEPTSGVDPLARRQFWRLINDFARRGTAVLVTTHYLEEAEQCNRMSFLVAGETVIEGSPSQIKAAQSGKLMEIVPDQNQTASDILKQHIEPWRVSIFADRLHVVVEDSDTEIPHLQSILESAHIQIVSLRPIPFSLEDAFIGTVQRAQREL
ncbi:ATP-binding cassette domain-containing protein [Kovacikia minuta CCNUW1]|uniref:ATP-binding cassette domain-containing protein n=1 Tax=Kovacikia minuta TaxID=2931930 RepID=UPI001CCC31C8|nr:ATP-binding cassette domain-containing protein [Kovacikia minuta]UBF24080.1 ATP-binding cassette domain-containing protein [Kovacikia minuta CCNUW1]